jgi:hypothetical protein
VSGVARLREALAAEGGAVAEALGGTPVAAEADLGPAQLGASGPRARGHADEYELLLEFIREGSLLHYSEPRVLTVADPDLALLLGDQLYALGLERLARLGDLEAVGELGRLISLLAQAHLRRDEALADALWQAGTVAVGWGTDRALRRAQELARAQDAGATQALLSAATDRVAVTRGEGAAASAER